MEDGLNASKIKSDLKTDFIASEILVLDSVDSTQDYVFRHLDKLSNGAVVLAESQKKGKGRLGRIWHSPVGGGIYMSVVLKDSFTPDILSQVALFSSLSLTKYLKSRYGFNFRVRWPNDVLVGHDKIAGVLAVMRDNILTVGMGINVNQNLQILPEAATSLFLITGEEQNRNKIIAQFLNCFEEDFYCWKREGYEYLRKLWEDFASLKGKSVVAQTNSKTIKGVVEDLACDCGLIIRGDMGFNIELNVNELIKIREMFL
ncbi:MAG: biotin--[acetyl-CoA-carboxylase] ligase [Candidatus Saelkia tenebricola]|nr:biotin--[acetyl-CoA-carboxylase] ligase [Candidatus Saelkia tenebricola]